MAKRLLLSLISLSILIVPHATHAPPCDHGPPIYSALRSRPEHRLQRAATLCIPIHSSKTNPGLHGNHIAAARMENGDRDEGHIVVPLTRPKTHALPLWGVIIPFTTTDESDYWIYFCCRCAPCNRWLNSSLTTWSLYGHCFAETQYKEEPYCKMEGVELPIEE